MGEPDHSDQKNQANMARHCRQNLGIYSILFWHTARNFEVKNVIWKIYSTKMYQYLFFFITCIFSWLFVCNYLVKGSLILLSVQRNRNVHVQRRKSRRSSFWVDPLCKEIYTNFVFFDQKLEWLIQLYIHLDFRHL